MFLRAYNQEVTWTSQADCMESIFGYTDNHPFTLSSKYNTSCFLELAIDCFGFGSLEARFFCLSLAVLKLTT